MLQNALLDASVAREEVCMAVGRDFDNWAFACDPAKKLEIMQCGEFRCL